MTHDELLVEIDIQLRHLPSYFHDEDKTILGMKALRAVVELHKPVEYPIGVSTDPDYKSPVEILCSCSRAFNDYDKVFYPCRNIQAIEKELA